MGICAERNAESARKAKISQLQVAVLVDQQILWLQIAMKNAMRVAVSNALAKLMHKLLDHSFSESQRTSCAIHDAVR